MDITQKFNALTEELRAQRIPCKLSHDGKEITIQLGMDYDDELSEKAWEASYKIGMKVNELSVCAESWGGRPPVESVTISGGPINYRANKYGNANQLINMLSRGRY